MPKVPAPSLSRFPRKPAIKIRASQSPVISQLKDAWAHRELLYFLIWRDLKVRYRQTLLGAGWVILQPLLTTIVFTVFLSMLVRVPSDGLPYPLFAYAGLLPWMFFSNSVSTSTYSLTSNSYIITKVYFPRLIIPAAIVGVRLVDFIVASVVLIGLMLGYGVSVTSGILLLPLLVAEMALFSLAISWWFSVLNVKYRDIGTLLPVLIQLWMFISPVIYPSSLVPIRWRPIYSLNPISGMLEAFRASLFGLPFDWTGLAISAVVTVVLFAYFIYVFCRWEEHLIDIL
ncbi:MAG: ABC transporter permease [Pyrinomonadaceae bacterium]|nr:ABC transporter permease [Pyrinomonadaceae bacterium]